MAMTAKSPLGLDTYVVETRMRDLVGHDLRPSAFLVYLAIASAAGARRLSYGGLAEMTGLSKRSVQEAAAHLARRKLVEIRRDGPTETAVYRALMPWRG